MNSRHGWHWEPEDSAKDSNTSRAVHFAYEESKRPQIISGKEIKEKKKKKLRRLLNYWSNI